MKKISLVFVIVVLLIGCGSKPETFDQLREAGLKAFVDKDYAHAREYLSRASILNPSHREVLYFLGLSYSRDYLYDSAFFYLGRADVLYPGDREINLELYNLASSLEDWEAVAKAIKVLMQTGDPLEQWDEHLAWLYRKQEKYYFSYYYYRRLLEREPDALTWHVDVANSALGMDSFYIALRVLDSALDRFGPSNELLTNKGLLLSYQGRLPESETLLREALALDSTEITTRINLARTLAFQTSIEKKQEAYDIYLQIQLAIAGRQDIDSIITKLKDELGIE